MLLAVGLAATVVQLGFVAANAQTPGVEKGSGAQRFTNLDRLLASKDNRIRELEAEVARLRQQCANEAKAASSSPAVEQSVTAGQGASVCFRGCEFSDLGKAVRSAQAGATITVAPEINGSCAVINKPLRLVGLKAPDGRRAHLAGGVCAGKGPLVVNSHDVTIEGFEISNVSVPSRNGACIRLDPRAQDVTVRDVYCHDSENGMLGEVRGQLTIEKSVFRNNGFDRGQAHGLYIGGDDVTIRQSQILATRESGHSLKIGAQNFLLEDSLVAALSSRNSRALDAFAGGNITLRRNVIQQGPKTENNDLLGIAYETKRLRPGNHSVTLENNWFIFDDPNRRNTTLINGKKLGPWNMRGNVMVGIRKSYKKIDNQDNNSWVPDRRAAKLPVWDGTTNTLPKPGQKPRIGTSLN